MKTIDDLPQCPVPPVPEVSNLSYNEEVGAYIKNNSGYKGYIGYGILTNGKPLSRDSISEKYKISVNTVKKTIQDNPPLFEVKDVVDGVELIGLSNQGLRYIKEIIENLNSAIS